MGLFYNAPEPTRGVGQQYRIQVETINAPDMQTADVSGFSPRSNARQRLRLHQHQRSSSSSSNNSAETASVVARAFDDRRLCLPRHQRRLEDELIRPHPVAISGPRMRVTTRASSMQGSVVSGPKSASNCQIDPAAAAPQIGFRLCTRPVVGDD